MRPDRFLLRASFGLIIGAAELTAAVLAARVVSRNGLSNQATAVVATKTPLYDVSTGFPQLNSPQTEDPIQPETRAVASRANVIRRDAAAIEAECQRVAAGDWNKWHAATAPYRSALKAKIDALPEIPGTPAAEPEWRYFALEGLNGFPLFELGPRKFLNHLYDPVILDEFRRARPVVAAHRWLRQRGIDLIFVPVPRMTEVYMEHFLDPCPPDGIIAPRVRQTLLELLREDVEVVDGLPLFRSLRDTDNEYLYNPADIHWAPRSMRIMAKELADRVERYKFGARARYGLPVFRTEPGFYAFGDLRFIGRINGSTGFVLAPEQQKRAQRAQTTTQSVVSTQSGESPKDDPTSPVLLIGHSYTEAFREQLAKELNLSIHLRVGAGETTEAFGDFLRQPELLDHCRVVVWITTEHHMTRFRPMPGPVMKALGSAR
jgi:hypothetical protein